jgi:hypothetical protein
LYTAETSRANPSAVLFLIDQSSSMGTAWGNDLTRTRAVVAADDLNNLLYELIMVCVKGGEVRNFLDVGVIGYGGQGNRVGPAFEGTLIGRNLVTMDELATNPFRVEEREKLIPDGAGGMVHTKYKIPVWFSPVCAGYAPLSKALEYAVGILEPWCACHPKSFPPLVVHFGGGQPSDGYPSRAVSKLTFPGTQDGSVLLLNYLFSELAGDPLIFPENANQLSSVILKDLYHASSPIPSTLLHEIEFEYSNVSSHGRLFILNDHQVTLLRNIILRDVLSRVRILQY